MKSSNVASPSKSVSSFGVHHARDFWCSPYKGYNDHSTISLDGLSKNKISVKQSFIRRNNYRLNGICLRFLIKKIYSIIILYVIVLTNRSIACDIYNS